MAGRRGLASPRAWIPRELQVSISWKIFALVTGLLFVLTAVALASLVRMDTVRGQVIDVAETHLPVTQRLTRLLEATLRQDLHLERARVLLAIRGNTAARDAWSAYLGLQAGQDAALAEASADAEQGRARAATEAERQGFAQLQVELRVLEEDLREVRQSDGAIAALFAAQPAAAAELQHELSGLVGRRPRLAQQARAILSRLEQAAGQAAAAANRSERAAMRWTAAVTVGAAILGLAFAWVLARSLTQPIRRLLRGIQEVESGHLDVEVTATTQDEIGQLTGAFNHMASEMREKALILETFGQYMDPRIVRKLIAEGRGALKSERQEMTVLFSDLAGYSSLSELLTPQGLVAMLNEFLDVSVDAIKERSGVIDKFIGDSVMAFWGPPFCVGEVHAQRAAESALRQVRALPELNRRLQDVIGVRTALPRLNVRFGIATGEVVVGNVGPKGARSFTVIGEAANLAQRLEQANKLYGTAILVSERTVRVLGGALPVREIDRLRLKGLAEAAPIYQLLDPQDDVPPEALQRFAEGLSAYRAGEWRDARRLWQASSQHWPQDPVARTFLSRLDELQGLVPSEWDGAWPPRLRPPPAAAEMRAS